VSATDDSPSTSFRTAALLGAGFAGLIALAGILAALLAGESPFYLFTRQFWIDETITFLLAELRNPVTQISRLREGADLNPPGHLLLLDLWHLIWWWPSEVSVRVFSLLSVAVGAMAIVLTLRRVFDLGTAVTATAMVLLVQQSLLLQAFEGRFYAPLFGAAGLLCLALNQRDRGWWTPASIFLAASLLCSIHYFGLFSAGLAIAGYAAGNLPNLRAILPRLVAAIAGVGTMVFYVPLVRAQKAALADAPTWLERPVFQDLTGFVSGSYAITAVFLAATALAVSAMLISSHGDQPPQDSATQSNSCRAAVATLLAFLLLPAVLLAFTYVVQPAYAPRYGVNTAIGVAAVTAWLLRSVDARLRLLLLAASLLIGVFNLVSAESRFRPPLFGLDRPVARAIAPVREKVTAETPLVAYRYLGYQSWRYGDLPADHVRILMPRSTPEAKLLDRHQWQMFENVAESMDAPHPIAVSDLGDLDGFYLLRDGSERQLDLSPLDKPHFERRLVSETGGRLSLYRFEVNGR